MVRKLQAAAIKLFREFKRSQILQNKLLWRPQGKQRRSFKLFSCLNIFLQFFFLKNNGSQTSGCCYKTFRRVEKITDFVQLVIFKTLRKADKILKAFFLPKHFPAKIFSQRQAWAVGVNSTVLTVQKWYVMVLPFIKRYEMFYLFLQSKPCLL
jgi:hypothetical protein